LFIIWIRVKEALEKKLGVKAKLLTECDKYKEDFTMTAKDAILSNSSEPIQGYFAAHPSLEPIHSLFVRKVMDRTKKQAVEYSLEKTDTEREVCSQMLSFCKAKLNFASSAFSYAYDDLIFVPRSL
jgi:hypothetical protein